MNILELNAENFSKEVLESEIPVLVDFGATWCAPCQRQEVVLKQFAEKYDKKIKLGKIDIDQSSDLAMTYRIKAVPTLMLFNKGEAIHTKVGLSNMHVMEDMLELLKSSK